MLVLTQYGELREPGEDACWFVAELTNAGIPLSTNYGRIILQLMLMGF